MFLSLLFSGLHSLPEKRKSTSPGTVVTLILSWDKEARQGPSDKRRFVLCRALGRAPSPEERLVSELWLGSKASQYPQVQSVRRN